MTNPLKGEVSREIAGETFTFVLDAEAICVAEFKLGVRGEPRPFKQIWASVAAFGTMTYVRGLMHAALQLHHPKITEARVGELMKALKVQGCLEVLSEAVKAAWGSDEEGEGAAADAPAGPQSPTVGGTG